MEPAATATQELEWDEFTLIDGNKCIGSGWAAPCTVILAQGDKTRPAYLGHFLRLATADGMVNLQIMKMLMEARKLFGRQLRVKIRGNSFFPHQGEHLRHMQLHQRQILEGMLKTIDIPADIVWSEDNKLIYVTFDARTGKETMETRDYVPASSSAGP